MSDNKPYDVYVKEQTLMRKIMDLTEVVYQGDFLFEEFYAKNKEDNFDIIEERLAELEKERQTNLSMNKKDEYLERSIKTLSAMIEIDKLREQLKQLNVENDLDGGFTLV